MSEEKSLKNKTVNGFLWTGLGTVGKTLLQLGVIAVLARLIEVESFGIVQAALVVVGFAKLISQMGIGPALVQRKELTESHIRVGFTLSLTLGLILGGVLFLFSDFFASFFNIEELTIVLKIISLLFLSESFITVSSSLLQRNMRFKEIAYIDLVSYFLGYGLMGIIFGYLGFDYWALLIAIFSQEIIKVILYFIIQKHSLKPMWSKKEFDDLIHYGGGHTIAKLANYFTGNGDNLIVSKYLGAQALGFYGQAFSLMVRPYNIVMGAIDKALFPALASIQSDKPKLKDNLAKIIRILALVVFPLISFIIVLAKYIVLVLLGEKWLGAVIPLQILSLTIVFRVSTRLSDVLVRATGDVYSRAWRRSISGVIMIISCYLGQRYWAINGVAWGVVFTSMVTFILMAHLTFKHIDYDWGSYLKLHIKGFVLGIVLALVVYSMKTLFEAITDISSIIFFSTTISSTLVFVGIFFKFKKFFLGNEKNIFVLMMNKMKLNRLAKYL